MFGSQPEKPSENVFPTSSIASYEGEELSPESERILASVPDAIEDTSDPVDGGDVQDVQGGVRITESASALATVGCIDPDDVRDTLLLLTGKIADMRKFEGWRITEEQAGKLARPYTRVVESLWERYAPAFLNSLNANVPGLMQAAIVTAVVFGPVIKADLSRKKPASEMTRPSAAHSARPEPAPAKPGGVSSMIWAEGE